MSLREKKRNNQKSKHREILKFCLLYYFQKRYKKTIRFFMEHFKKENTVQVWIKISLLTIIFSRIDLVFMQMNITYFWLIYLYGNISVMKLRCYKNPTKQTKIDLWFHFWICQHQSNSKGVVCKTVIIFKFNLNVCDVH